MPKFIHLLHDPNDLSDLAQTDSRLSSLQAAGAVHLTYMHADDHVVPAAGLRMQGRGPQFWATISYTADQALLSDAEFGAVSTYQVAERAIIPRAQKRGRLDGFSQVTILHKRADISDQDFNTIWLGDHADVAVETQANLYYHQYPRPIALNDSAATIDGIVEEGFPDAAMTDPAIFFDGRHDPARFDRNRAAMIASVQRFLDLRAITVIPMSAYCL